MCNRIKVDNCKNLILMLRKKNQSELRALEVYNRRTYNLAIQELNLGERCENGKGN